MTSRAGSTRGEVAAILAALDCEVSIIDAAALAAIDPSGSAASRAKRDTTRPTRSPTGRTWRRCARRRRASRKPFDPGPAYVSCPPYTMDAGRPRRRKEGGEGETKRTESHRIAAPFEVLGACRDPHGAGWGKMLRWRDDDGRAHVRHVADADLHGEPARALRRPRARRLADRSERSIATFVGYLSAVRPKRRVTIVSRTGWHDIGGRSVFVLPGETIGPRGGERVILDAAAMVLMRRAERSKNGATARQAGERPCPARAGDIRRAGRAAVASRRASRAAASISMGHRPGQDDAVASLPRAYGGAAIRPAMCGAWRATANGLEGAAAGATDTRCSSSTNSAKSTRAKRARRSIRSPTAREGASGARRRVARAAELARHDDIERRSPG